MHRPCIDLHGQDGNGMAMHTLAWGLRTDRLKFSSLSGSFRLVVPQFFYEGELLKCSSGFSFKVLLKLRKYPHLNLF